MHIKWSDLRFLICFIAWWQAISSAEAQKQRHEIPAHMYSDDFYLVPIESTGLLVFRESPSKEAYQFVKYDQAFKKQWQVEIDVQKKLEYQAHYYINRTLYVLFGQSNRREVEIIKLNTQAGFYEKTKIYTVNNLYVEKFVAWQDGAYLLGDILGDPVLVYLDIAQRRTALTSLETEGYLTLDQLKLDTLRERVILSALHSPRAREFEVMLKIFQKGKLQKDIILKSEEDKYLLNGRLLSSPQGDWVIGNYGLASARRQVQGIYTVALDAAYQAQKFQYYDFTDFDNYFNYLEPEQAQREKAKVQARRAKDKPYFIHYQAYLQDVIPCADHITLTHLFFQSIFQDRSYSSTRPPQPWIEGWNYSHAFISAWDYEGKPLWQDALDLVDLKGKQHQNWVHLQEATQAPQAAYYHYDQIYKKELLQDSSAMLEEIAIQDIQESGKIQDFLGIRLAHWYDQYFLLWGFQKIKNREKGGRRQVFFFQRMEFDSEAPSRDASNEH